jgi:hypothetical protein
MSSPHTVKGHVTGMVYRSREIGLAGVELAPFAGAHDLAGVGDRSGPVEALTERIAHEGAWCCVMAAHARMYIPEELAPLRDGHASL